MARIIIWNYDFPRERFHWGFVMKIFGYFCAQRWIILYSLIWLKVFWANSQIKSSGKSWISCCSTAEISIWIRFYFNCFCEPKKLQGLMNFHHFFRVCWCDERLKVTSIKLLRANDYIWRSFKGVYQKLKIVVKIKSFEEFLY